MQLARRDGRCGVRRGDDVFQDLAQRLGQQVRTTCEEVVVRHAIAGVCRGAQARRAVFLLAVPLVQTRRVEVGAVRGGLVVLRVLETAVLGGVPQRLGQRGAGGARHREGLVGFTTHVVVDVADLDDGAQLVRRGGIGRWGAAAGRLGSTGRHAHARGGHGVVVDAAVHVQPVGVGAGDRVAEAKGLGGAGVGLDGLGVDGQGRCGRGAADLPANRIKLVLVLVFTEHAVLPQHQSRALGEAAGIDGAAQDLEIDEVAWQGRRAFRAVLGQHVQAGWGDVNPRAGRVGQTTLGFSALGVARHRHFDVGGAPRHRHSVVAHRHGVVGQVGNLVGDGVLVGADALGVGKVRNSCAQVGALEVGSVRADAFDRAEVVDGLGGALNIGRRAVVAHQTRGAGDAFLVANLLGERCSGGARGDVAEPLCDEVVVETVDATRNGDHVQWPADATPVQLIALQPAADHRGVCGAAQGINPGGGGQSHLRVIGTRGFLGRLAGVVARGLQQQLAHWIAPRWTLAVTQLV